MTIKSSSLSDSPSEDVVDIPIAVSDAAPIAADENALTKPAASTQAASAQAVSTQDSAAQASPKNLPVDVGERLQRVRLASGLSQRELARRANLTNGSLSMIEQGKVSPSISSLQKILNVIPMTLTEFFSDAMLVNPPVFRQDDFTLVRKDAVTTAIMPLSEYRQHHVALARQTFSTGASVSSDWMTRKGFVAGIVVNGSLCLYLDGKEYVLQTGEGFHFSSHRSHKFENPYGVPAEVVAVSLADTN